MIEDIYEPLARYRDEFREKFSRISADTFERLVKESGVDISANAATVAEIKNKEAELCVRLAQLIEESQRPLMIVGGGIIISESHELARELARKCDIPDGVLY